MSLQDEDDDDGINGQDGDEVLEDSEGPDDADLADADEPAMVRCASCGKYILEDAERCHHCGHYPSRDDGSFRVPIWILIGALLAGIGVILWIFK